MNIKAMDQGLLPYLDGPSIDIKLTAVFQNSCYGFYEDVLITILPENKSLLPRSVTLEGPWRSSNFKIGQVLSLGYGSRDTLRIHEGTKRQDLSLQGQGLLDLVYKFPQIRGFLYLSESFPIGIGKVFDLYPSKDQHFVAGSLNLMEDEIKSRIIAIIAALKEKKEIQAKNIIGYGLGLTPSADDFLLGIASVLEGQGQEGRREKLKDYILAHVEGTTEVSRFMLYYGTQSHIYPQFLKEFLTKSINLNEDFKGFLAHGSTSGMDLLAGVFAGIQIVMED